MAATAMALAAVFDPPPATNDIPAHFEAGVMTDLAYKTLARGCSEASGPEFEWVSQEECVLVPH